MDKQTKVLALQAIEQNVQDTTAREIVKWTMGMELKGSDTINPSNQYFAKKFGWADTTVRQAIYLAKKSGFITTVGTKKSRTFELNVQFLKGKMAEIQAKRPLRNNALLQELSAVLPHNLSDSSPDVSPDASPDVSPDAEQILNVNVDVDTNYVSRQVAALPASSSSISFDEKKEEPQAAQSKYHPEPPAEPTVNALHFRVIKHFNLPVRNHSQIKPRSDKMEQEIGTEAAIKYLETMLAVNWQELPDDFKPTLNTSDDIYFKRVAIQRYLKGNGIDTESTESRAEFLARKQAEMDTQRQQDLAVLRARGVEV